MFYIKQMLVSSMDSFYNHKTHPDFCLSNDKCSVLRKWKYFGGSIKSVGEKIAQHMKLLDGNKHLQVLALSLAILCIIVISLISMYNAKWMLW